MKFKALNSLFLPLLIVILCAGPSLAQEEPIDDGQQTTTTTTTSDSDGETKDQAKSTASILAGATTVEGMNYQQIGFRGELPIGKLGLGLDIILLLDEKGNIREEDWDEIQDYLDKLYYVRWAQKQDPFYFKVGGLDFTTMGYGGIMYGYSNMVEYPTYKRVGLELGVTSEYFGLELFGNDFKELIDQKPSMIVGTRATVKPFGGSFSFGLSVVSDLNQYNGLRDNDGDGYADKIDVYPYNSSYATERGKLQNQDPSFYDDPTLDKLAGDGVIDPTKEEDLLNLNEADSKPLTIWGADMGINVWRSKNNFFVLDIYSQFAQITNTNGWGIAIPGIRFKMGPVRFSLDYRMSSDEFLFGYFNNTYELERAKYVQGDSGQLEIQLKEDTLTGIEGRQGVFGSLDVNILNLLTARASYQDLMLKNSSNIRSLSGELLVKKDLVPFINEAKAYYFQNNVADFKEWKTPSTIMGYMIALGVNDGVSVVFDYRYTFEDLDGDGRIKGADETIETFSISSTSTF